MPLGDLAACPPAPNPEPPRKPSSFHVVLEYPPGAVAGDRIEAMVHPGLYERAGGGECGVIEVRAVRPGTEEASPWSVSDPSCTPIPEPSVGVALVVGVVVLAGLARRLAVCTNPS